MFILAITIILIINYAENWPVKVTIPSRIFEESMELYTGEANDDSSVNWVNPVKLDTSAAVKNL